MQPSIHPTFAVLATGKRLREERALRETTRQLRARVKEAARREGGGLYKDGVGPVTVGYDSIGLECRAIAIGRKVNNFVAWSTGDISGQLVPKVRWDPVFRLSKTVLDVPYFDDQSPPLF